MRQTYLTITYLPGREQDDHGVQQQVAYTRVDDRVLKVYGDNPMHNSTRYRGIPLDNIATYDVEEYR